MHNRQLQTIYLSFIQNITQYHNNTINQQHATKISKQNKFALSSCSGNCIENVDENKQTIKLYYEFKKWQQKEQYKDSIMNLQ